MEEPSDYSYEEDIDVVAKAYDDATRYLNRMYDNLQDFYVKQEYDEAVDIYDHFVKLIPDTHPATKVGLVNYRKFIEREFDTMPSYIYVRFRSFFKDLKGNDKIDAIRTFINNNLTKINNCRDLYMEMNMRAKQMTEESVLEETRKELLDIALVDRPKRLDLPAFRREASLKLIDLPQLMTWRQMYDFYLQNSKETISILDDAANFNEHTAQTADETTRNDKYDYDSGHIRKKYHNVSPWKSGKKLREYSEKNNISPVEQDALLLNAGTDSFNLKRQRQLMKHHAAPRHTFVIDYMFAGRFRYLIAVNVNTRKAFFAIPDEISRRGHNWSVKGKVHDWNVSSKSAVNSLKHLLAQTKVKHLIMDQESAWTSNEFKKFLENNGIQYKFIHINDLTNIIETKNPKRPNHSTTSLVDRLIRTLKTMNYNVGNKTEISPSILSWLIDEYNSSPHTTLSRILKRSVTPNDVDKDKNLERKIVSELMRENFITGNKPEYKVSGVVRVYNEASHFDKVKPKLLPGRWKVIGTKDGLVELEQNGRRIKVNRWMIKS